MLKTTFTFGSNSYYNVTLIATENINIKDRDFYYIANFITFYCRYIFSEKPEIAKEVIKVLKEEFNKDILEVPMDYDLLINNLMGLFFGRLKRYDVSNDYIPNLVYQEDTRLIEYPEIIECDMVIRPDNNYGVVIKFPFFKDSNQNFPFFVSALLIHTFKSINSLHYDQLKFYIQKLHSEIDKNNYKDDLFLMNTPKKVMDNDYNTIEKTKISLDSFIIHFVKIFFSKKSQIMHTQFLDNYERIALIETIPIFKLFVLLGYLIDIPPLKVKGEMKRNFLIYKFEEIIEKLLIKNDIKYPDIEFLDMDFFMNKYDSEKIMYRNMYLMQEQEINYENKRYLRTDLYCKYLIPLKVEDYVYKRAEILTILKNTYKNLVSEFENKIVIDVRLNEVTDYIKEKGQNSKVDFSKCTEKFTNITLFPFQEVENELECIFNMLIIIANE